MGRFFPACTRERTVKTVFSQFGSFGSDPAGVYGGNFGAIKPGTKPPGAGFASPRPGAWICSDPGSACSPCRLRLTDDHPTPPKVGHHAAGRRLRRPSPQRLEWSNLGTPASPGGSA